VRVYETNVTSFSGKITNDEMTIHHSAGKVLVQIPVVTMMEIDVL